MVLSDKTLVVETKPLSVSVIVNVGRVVATVVTEGGAGTTVSELDVAEADSVEFLVEAPMGTGETVCRTVAVVGSGIVMVVVTIEMPAAPV